MLTAPVSQPDLECLDRVYLNGYLALGAGRWAGGAVPAVEVHRPQHRRDAPLPGFRCPEYVNHYSYHLNDSEWGHVTIKMSGHPTFGAQIILNSHEFVARQANAAGIAFRKAGNYFTAVTDPAGLARSQMPSRSMRL